MQVMQFADKTMEVSQNNIWLVLKNVFSGK